MEFIQTLFPQVSSIGEFGYWVMVLVSLLESIVLAGIFVPGSFFVMFTGFLAQKGVFDWKTLTWFVSLGAFLGYAISFELGRRGATLARNKKWQDRFARGELFFKKYGDASIPLSRFFGPLRLVIPFTAGLFTMRRSSFYIQNLASAFLYALWYLSLGYYFGSGANFFSGLF